MIRKIVILVFGIIMILSFRISAFPSIEKERLLFEDIPIIYTSSRKPQPITEAASTIDIITSEDIRHSGATNIPDLLRRVPGVDVITIDAKNQQVSIRGLNFCTTHYLLVLIDDRTVYTDFHGNVFWDSFPVGLDEIDRIEVVKSPSSSIYGANAFCGVINIITKKPEDIDGTKFNITGGTSNTIISSFLAGRRKENFSYKISGEWNHTNEGVKSNRIASYTARLNANFEYRFNEKNKLTLSGGGNLSPDKNLLAGPFMGVAKEKFENVYFRLDYKISNLNFRTFIKKEDLNLFWPKCFIDMNTKNPFQINGKFTTADFELLHSFFFNIIKPQSFIWGISFRINYAKKNQVIPENKSQSLFSLFLEDEIEITDKLRITMGGRYDNYQLIESKISPRFNVFYSLSPKDKLRISFAKAFRSPSFVESFVRLNARIDLLAQIFYNFKGDKENLKAESVEAYEFGYMSMISEFLTFKLNLFYNKYSNLMAATLPDPLTGNSFVKSGIKASGIGGEISLDFSTTKGISGFVNYAFQHNHHSKTIKEKIVESGMVTNEYPQNKINAGLNITFKNNLFINLMANWVDKLNGIKIGKENEANSVKSYFILNTNIGYSLMKSKLQLNLSIQNLFNNIHYEYFKNLDTMPLPDHSYPIGRYITFGLKYNF
ncbi:MAG: TonB-dependent receptor plug domain-containing protein [Candidatus Omnitrophota bacterium]